MMEYTYKKAEKATIFERVKAIEFYPLEVDKDVKLKTKKGQKYWKRCFGIPVWKKTAKTDLYSFTEFVYSHHKLEDIKDWTDINYFWPRCIKNDKLYKCARIRIQLDGSEDRNLYFEDNEKAYKKYEECLKKCEECGNLLH